MNNRTRQKAKALCWISRTKPKLDLLMLRLQNAFFALGKSAVQAAYQFERMMEASNALSAYRIAEAEKRRNE